MEDKFKKLMEEKPSLYGTPEKERAQAFADYAKKVGL